MCVGSVCTHPSYNDKIGFPIPILLHASWPIPILILLHANWTIPIPIFLHASWPIPIPIYLFFTHTANSDFITRKLDNSDFVFTGKLANSDFFFFTKAGQFRYRFFLHANWTILIPILFLHTSWTIRYRFFVSQFPQKYCAARLFSTLIIIRNVSYHKSAYDYDF